MSLDPLDTDLLIQQTFVAQVEHHARLGSTNDRARRCAADGIAPLPLLIVADEQTAGRGRGTNRWWTGPGSLAFSLLLDAHVVGKERWVAEEVACGVDASIPPHPNCLPPRESETNPRPIGRGVPLVALAAGVAVAKTVMPLLPSRTVGVHWPNDVFVDGRKLAGVLVEVLSGGHLVVGIGVNVNNSLRDAPKELRASATTLWELTGTRHPRTQILVTLLGHLARAVALLASAPDEIAAEVSGLCLQHGRTLTVRSGQRVVSGRCGGIASDGALLLDTPQGRQRFYSGVVR